MTKLLIISILLATLLIPLRSARRPSARAGLKATLTYMALFNLLYIAFVLIKVR